MKCNSLLAAANLLYVAFVTARTDLSRPCLKCSQGDLPQPRIARVMLHWPDARATPQVQRLGSAYAIT
jgi:hypothetical protein